MANNARVMAIIVTAIAILDLSVSNWIHSDGDNKMTQWNP